MNGQGSKSKNSDIGLDDIAAWMVGEASEQQRAAIEADLDRDDSRVRALISWLSDPQKHTLEKHRSAFIARVCTLVISRWSSFSQAILAAFEPNHEGSHKSMRIFHLMSKIPVKIVAFNIIGYLIIIYVGYSLWVTVKPLHIRIADIKIYDVNNINQNQLTAIDFDLELDELSAKAEKMTFDEREAKCLYLIAIYKRLREEHPELRSPALEEFLQNPVLRVRHKKDKSTNAESPRSG